MINCNYWKDIEGEEVFVVDHSKNVFYVYRFDIVTSSNRYCFIGTGRNIMGMEYMHKRLLVNGKHWNDEMLDIYNRNKDKEIDFKFYVIGATSFCSSENRMKMRNMYNYYISMFDGCFDNCGRTIKIIERRN